MNVVNIAGLGKVRNDVVLDGGYKLFEGFGCKLISPKSAENYI